MLSEYVPQRFSALGYTMGRKVAPSDGTDLIHVANWFATATVPFHMPTNTTWFQFFLIITNTYFFFIIFIMAILVDMRGYLIES